MRTLLVSHREVTGLLSMHDCIDAMTDAFRALATGDARLPLRQVVSLPGSPNLLALMPGQLGVNPRERHLSLIHI